MVDTDVTTNKLDLIQRRILSGIISISILLFFAYDAQAKKPARGAQAPSGGEEAIESVYHSLGDLSAKFTQTTQVKLIDRTVVRQGIFRFKKGGKWRIEYEGAGVGASSGRTEGSDRGAKHYVSDGTTLWIYVPGDLPSLQTYAVTDETVPKEALSFLSGFGKLKKEFAVSRSDAFPDAPAGTTALRLVPRSGAKHYESLDALFGPDHLLAEIIVRNVSGNVSRYSFSDVRTNAGLPDSLFSLSAGKATPDTLPE